MILKNTIKEHSKTRPENWGINYLKLPLKLVMGRGEYKLGEKNRTQKEPLWDSLLFLKK